MRSSVSEALCLSVLSARALGLGGMGPCDKEAVIELARYKSSGVASLVIVRGFTPFTDIKRSERIGKSDAKAIGKKIASEWIDERKSLSEILEAHGIFVVELPGVSGLFRGLFIRKRGVPIVAIYDYDRGTEEIIKDIAH